MRAPAEAVGRCISGKYRLGEVLAVGGMGVVHAGVHLVTGRAVAIKRLRSELVSDPDIVRRVSREATLAVDASHPNVVEVLDAGADEGGVPYLVLERLFGQTLEALLDVPLALLGTAQALVPIANAVAALHRIGIVHRDIKPNNIFLHRDQKGRVTPKLLDFGIAKALARSGATLTGVRLGTPAYMAPEQALGYHAGGAASDVWSMSVVFARCLTGRFPFEHGAGESMTLRSGLFREQLPGVPDAVATVLARALAFEPAERPVDMAAFRDEMLQALAAVDTSALWPGEGTIGYAPTEFALSSACEHDAACVDPAMLGGARPVGVDTRTLKLAGRARCAGGARFRQPALRGRTALAAAALALAALSGRDRQASETSGEAQRGASSTASCEEAASLARVGAPNLVPSVVCDPAHEPRPDESLAPPSTTAASSIAPSSAGTRPRAVAIAASPSPASPSSERPGIASRAAARGSREPAPVVAYSPASHRGSSQSGHAALKFRVGANRAPIIE